MSQVDTGIAADSIRAVVGDVFAGTEYNWRVVPDPWRWLRRAFATMSDWFEWLYQEHRLAYWVLVAVMLAAVLAIIMHFGYLIFRALRPRRADQQASQELVREIRDAGWYLDVARRLESEGRYLESLVNRFTALLLELERRKVLQFHPSKTPAEYVGEASLDAENRAGFAEVVSGLYRHVFGGVPVQRDDLAIFDRHVAHLTSSRAT